MNFKLKGRTLLNGDIIQPEIPYATFSDDLNKEDAKRIVCNLNHGHDLMMIYKECRTNLHVKSVVEMLERMEKVFLQYDSEMYLISKGK